MNSATNSSNDNCPRSQELQAFNGKTKISGFNKTKISKLCHSDNKTSKRCPGGLAKAFRTTTFNLEPQIIPRLSLCSSSSVPALPSIGARLNGVIGGVEENDDVIMDDDVSMEHQLKAIRDHSRRRVRRLVAFVGLSLTVLCVVLVVVSLSFGPKLEEMALSSANGKSYFLVNPTSTFTKSEITKNVTLIGS